MHDQNTELNISLLDQRFLGGDRTLYAALAATTAALRARQSRRPGSQPGATDARAPRQVSRDTFYHLEPNVKDTPGGLRDYQLVCWLEQLRQTDQRAWDCRACRRTARGVPLPGAPALLSALPERPRQQRAFLRRAGRHRGAVAASPTPRTGCATTTATRATFTARRSASLEAGEGAVQQPLCAVARLALPRLPTRISACIASASTFARRSSSRRNPNWRCACSSSLGGTACVLRTMPSAHRGAPCQTARPLLNRRRRCGPRCRPILPLPHAPAGRARHARDRPADRDLPRTGTHRVPGGARFLSPLHGGRAHPGDAAESVGPAARPGRRAAQFPRPACRGQGPGAAVVRAAVSRCR